jgi:hypothetical protein
MIPIEDDPSTLRRHFTGTYFRLRVGIAAIGVALPIVLWVGRAYLDGEVWVLLGSISIYYHTGIRDVFVGALVSIGVCLYLYKGFSRREDWALNLAGVFVVCVALIPTRNSLVSPLPPRTGWHNAHLIAALLFFACIAYVSIFRASDTLRLIRNPDRARALRSTYWLLGALMIVLPPLAAIFARVSQTPGTGSSWVFGLEAGGVWAFAAYWIVKSVELSRTDAEQAAGEGKLQAAPPAPRGREEPGRLVQIAPLGADEPLLDVEPRGSSP